MNNKTKQKHQVGENVIIMCATKLRPGRISDAEFENNKWTYRVGFDEVDFMWVGENEIYTNWKL